MQIFKYMFLIKFRLLIIQIYVPLSLKHLGDQYEESLQFIYVYY
jgi:hypothetical protein